jgi:peptide/nickel transport system substrate-binding protein
MDPKSAITVRAGWEQIVKVDTPDQYTAVVHLKVPYAPFVGIVLTGRFGHLLPEHVYRDIPDLARSKYARKPVGNGPFEVVEWVSGDHITLKRNESYWGPKANLDRIILKFVPDRNALVAGIKAGDFDIAFDLDPVELSKIENDPNLQTLVRPGTLNERISFNLNDPNDLSKPHPVLGDRRVRLAFAHAIDRKGIVDGLLFGKPTVGVNDLDNTAYAHPNLKPYPYDPDKARQLLEEAGWKVGSDGTRVKDGKRLTVAYTTAAGNVLRERMQVVIQRFLQDVGFEVKIQNYRSAQISAGCPQGGITATRQFDLHQGSAGVSGTDPDIADNYMKATIPDCKTNPYGRNSGGFWTPELEEILRTQMFTLDVAKRKKLMYRAQEILYENAPRVWLFNRPDIVAFKKRVKGLDPTLPMSGGMFWNTEVWSGD